MVGPRRVEVLASSYVDCEDVVALRVRVTGLEAVFRFDGVFVLIYLVSIIANLISLRARKNFPPHGILAAV